MIAFKGHSVMSLGQPAATEVQRTAKALDFTSSHLTGQYKKAFETYNFYVSMLGERRFECAKELVTGAVFLVSSLPAFV